MGGLLYALMYTCIQCNVACPKWLYKDQNMDVHVNVYTLFNDLEITIISIGKCFHT